MATAPGRAGVPVVHVQAALTAHGYAPADGVSGVFSRPTVEALTVFQRDHGLPATGTVDHQTAAVLASAQFSVPTSPPAVTRSVNPLTAAAAARMTASPTRPGLVVASMVLAPAISVPASGASPASVLTPGSVAATGGGAYPSPNAQDPASDGSGGSASVTQSTTSTGDKMNLTLGSTGPSVIQVQTILKGMGYDLGPAGIDGKYGPATAGAVTHYQQDHQLTADGVVGPQTAAMLGIELPDASGHYSDGSSPGGSSTGSSSGGQAGKMGAGTKVLLGGSVAAAAWGLWKWLSNR